MDKFEKKIKEMENESKEKRKVAINKLKDICECPTCLTYNDCAKTENEGLFCVTGTSKSCITEPKECKCSDCDLAKSFEIESGNDCYCLRGSEIEQRTMGVNL